MKIDKKPNLEISIGTDGSDSSFFSFDQENLAHIFEMLRDAYSDKKLAIVREYSTNAFDAHVEAGKRDVPISVHIPTIQESYFSIRDYGLGLTEEKILKLYTSYGASSKNDSNDFNGMLGIGSKSGFCYAKSFTIISRNSGFKREFLCFIDETNLGKITKVSEEECDINDTGLEVVIKCHSADVSDFVNKCRFFYSTFEVRPNFNIELKLPKLIFSQSFDFNYEANGTSENYAVKLKKYEDFYEPGILMGNVLYRIPANTYSHHINIFSGMTIEVPIGSIKFSNSREQVSLDKNSQKFLDALFPFLRKELNNFVQKGADNCKNVLDFSFFYSIFHTNIAKEFPFQIKYNASKEECKFEDAFLYIGFGSDEEGKLFINDADRLYSLPTLGAYQSTSLFLDGDAVKIKSIKSDIRPNNLNFGSLVYFKFFDGKARICDLIKCSKNKFKSTEVFRYSSEPFFNFYSYEIKRLKDRVTSIRGDIDFLEGKKAGEKAGEIKKAGVKVGETETNGKESKYDQGINDCKNRVKEISEKISKYSSLRKDFDDYIFNSIKNIKSVKPIFDSEIIEEKQRVKVDRFFSIKLGSLSRKKYKLQEILDLKEGEKKLIFVFDTDDGGDYVHLFNKKFYSHELNCSLINLLLSDFSYFISRQSAERFGIVGYTEPEKLFLHKFLGRFSRQVDCLLFDSYRNGSCNLFEDCLSYFYFNKSKSPSPTAFRASIFKLFDSNNISTVSEDFVKNVIKKVAKDSDDCDGAISLINTFKKSRKAHDHKIFSFIETNILLNFIFANFEIGNENDLNNYINDIEKSFNTYIDDRISEANQSNDPNEVKNLTNAFNKWKSSVDSFFKFINPISKYLEKVVDPIGYINALHFNCEAFLRDCEILTKYNYIYKKLHNKISEIVRAKDIVDRAAVSSKIYGFITEIVSDSDDELNVHEKVLEYFTSGEFRNGFFEFCSIAPKSKDIDGIDVVDSAGSTGSADVVEGVGVVDGAKRYDELNANRFGWGR